MRKILTIFMLLLFFLQLSCIFDGPPQNNDPVDETKYGYVSPSSGKLGTKIRFFDLDSTDYPLDEYKILFTGLNRLITPDSITSEGIYTSVPFDAKHGAIRIVHYQVDSTDFSGEGSLENLINRDTVYINYFDVTEYSSHIDIRLTWFNLNYTINQSHAMFRDGKIERAIQWTGEVRGDTTWLYADYEMNGESYHHELSFYSIRGNDILPELRYVYSLHNYTKYGVEYNDRDYFAQGVVKLQTWRPGELVSGRVITSLGNLNNFHFWCDFSE